MSLSKKIVFNTAVQVASKTLSVFFTLLTTILLTSYLGRESFGDYIYVITLMVMFGSLADWGTATIGIRESAKQPKKQGQILANILVLRLLLSFLAAGLLIVLAFIVPLQTSNPEFLRQAIIAASLFLIFNALKSSFGIVFQVKLQMQKMAIADIATSALIFLFSWFFIQQQLGLVSLIIAYLLAIVSGLVLAACLAFKTIKFVFRFDRQIISKLIKESLPMGAILLMFTIDNKIDTVMLGAIKGSGTVGIYGIAYRVYDVLILGAAFLMNALLPVFSKWSNVSQEGNKLKQGYQKAFDVLILMGVGVVILVWFLAPWMVQILTQQKFIEFADAVVVLRILSLAVFLAYFNHLTGYTIIALGRQRSYFFVALTALIFNVTANLFFIPRFSYYGAATVTILTEAIVLVITTIFIFRLLKFIPSFFSFPKTAVQLMKQVVIGRKQIFWQ